MPDLLKFYGFRTKNNRIQCPLHFGNDFNCGVKDDYIHCFVCEESADIIKLTMRYFKLSFKESVTKLNDDFCLGLPIGEKLDRRKRIELARKSFKAKQERERRLNEHNRLKNALKSAFDEWIRLDIQKMKYKPKTENEDLHPLFVEAIINLPHAEYRLECAEKELYLYETRNRCNT